MSNRASPTTPVIKRPLKRPLAELQALLMLIIIAFGVVGCASDELPTLHVFTWMGLLKKELITEFEEKYHCRVVIDTYDSNESMYSKLKLAPGSYDLIFPTNYYLKLLEEQEMVQKLNREEIPNLQLIDPRYIAPSGPVMAAPFVISFTGIAYRKDKLLPIEPSWEVFDRADLKGRMTMLNDPREAIGAALKSLGYSVNSTDPVAIDRAVERLLSWKKNLAKFDNEQYKNGLSSAEFLVVQGYSIDIAQVIQEDSEVVFLYPREGNVMSIDYIAIPKTAKSVDLANAFINFLLEPTNAQKSIAYMKSLVPVPLAYQLLTPEQRDNPLLFPSAEILERMELVEGLGAAEALYYNAWERIKAG